MEVGLSGHTLNNVYKSAFPKKHFCLKMLSGESSFENKSVLTMCYETKKILIIAKLSINLQTDNRVRRLYLNHAYNNT